METPNLPQAAPLNTDFKARLLALHDIKHKLEQLHAHLEFLRLMLKLGVRLH